MEKMDRSGGGLPGSMSASWGGRGIGGGLIRGRLRGGGLRGWTRRGGRMRVILEPDLWIIQDPEDGRAAGLHGGPALGAGWARVDLMERALARGPADDDVECHDEVWCGPRPMA